MYRDNIFYLRGILPTSRVYTLPLYCLVFLFSLPAFSQRPDISFHHINTSKGLSHGFTRKVLQDHQGYMWFATANGLNKFDGYKMSVFKNDPDDSNSISSNEILTLNEDKSKNLWIGTNKGMNLYSKEQNNFKHFPELADAFITSFLQDESGNIWVSSKKEIFKYDSILERFRKVNIKDDKFTYFNLFEDSNNTIWIGTFEGLAKLDRKKEKVIFFPDVIVMDISSLYEDKHKNLWIGSRGMGVVVYNLTTKNITRFEKELSIPTNVVLAINADSLGRIWIGTENGGLSIYNPKTNQFYKYLNNPSDPSSLCFNSVYSITRDNYQNIWLGTFSGVELVKNDKFAHIRPNFLSDNSLPSGNVLTFTEDRSGKIWIGTDGEGLSILDPSTRKFTNFKNDPNDPKSLSSNAVTYLYEDKLGNIWIGTWGGGLNLYNKEKNNFVRFRFDPRNIKTIQNENITHIYEDKRNNLWIGTGSGIELLDRNTNEFTHFHHMFQGSLLGSYPSDLLEDKDGNFWIATFDGLCIFDRDKKVVIPFLHESSAVTSISSNVIYTLSEDSKGNLWIGTAAGLNLFNKKTKKFTQFHEKDGLPSDAIYGILEDSNGFIWLSTSNGVCKLDPAKRIFKNYSVDDGLQGNEFKQNAFIKLRNGEMLLGGDNGFNWFYPSLIKDNQNYTPVLITDFKIFNKSVPIKNEEGILNKHISETKEIELSYRNTVISFEYAALNYFSPERNQYAYKLVGFEDEWNYVGNKREATYTSLDPGEYYFKVKASNNDGVWNEKGATIKIIITPPFWSSWWFRAFIVLSILLLVNIFIRVRIKNLHKQREILKKLVVKKTKEILIKNKILEKTNQELSRQKEEILNQKNEIVEMSHKVKESDEKKLKFFTNISHEIRTPLTLILGPAERLVEKSATEPKLHDELSILYKNAHRLLNLVNELMDFNKMDSGEMKVYVGKGDIVKFCSEAVFAFEELVENKQINLSYNSNKDIYETRFDSTKLEVVLFNLISNAFKFTSKNGKINVSLEIDDFLNQIKFAVEDNGIGIEERKLPKIFDRYYQIETTATHHKGTGLGLAYTKEVVDLMEGQIEVESSLGKGTKFTITLPLITDTLLIENKKFVELSDQSLKFNIHLYKGLIEFDKTAQESLPRTLEPGERILIVDDNDDLRNYIKKCLGDKYLVLEAKNGNEGLSMAKSHFPKIIISDLMMPEMDGLEFCSKIKSDLEVCHIPLILLTAKTTKESQIEGYQLGADDYITKPFSADILITRVENLIKSRKQLKDLFKEKVNLEPRAITVTSPDEKFLKKAMEIVENNLHKAEFDASEFVKEIGMSRSLVYMKLRELIDLSPAEFIKNTRLKRACQLLKNKKHRISDVCYMIGFTDPHYFSISFKKLFGKTPSEYCEEHNT